MNTGSKKLSISTAPERITFRNASLIYSEKHALDNINLELVKGQKIAITGENGSGKTSFINLLLRFNNPSAGNVYFDDINIKNYDISEYRNLFAVISQDVKLFNKNIRENIDPFSANSDEKILNVFEMLGFTNFIKELPGGLETMTGRNGVKFSGGEGQKLAAVRAIIKESKILVIDEATSNYDYESEKVFNDVISSNLMYDYVVVITHRESILEKMDRVIRLDNGRITDDAQKYNNRESLQNPVPGIW